MSTATEMKVPDKDINKVVGLNIRAERVRRELTQKDMAQKIGISKSAYQTRESGQVSLYLDEIKAICCEFDCSPSFLCDSHC